VWRQGVLIFLLVNIGFSFKTERSILVLIDGARFSETFGDSSLTIIPRMKEISKVASVCMRFYNDSITYTRNAVPAIWCGAWTEIRDTIDENGRETQYPVLPTVFEYIRKDLDFDGEEVFYVLSEVYSPWLFSFHPDYGPPYWPTYWIHGSSDEEVVEEAQYVLSTFHPTFMMVYLKDVDHAGHSGNWDYYLSTVRKADSLVGVLFDFIEKDDFYKGRTALLVTNDHGRHDDEHGGFAGHGDGCEGCRHIMFLAYGPDFKKGFRDTLRRTLRDIVPTLGTLLGFKSIYSTGDNIEEILKEGTQGEEKEEILSSSQLNFFGKYLFLNLNDSFTYKLEVYSLSGRLLMKATGESTGEIPFPPLEISGVFLYRLDAGGRKIRGFWFKLK